MNGKFREGWLKQPNDTGFQTVYVSKIGSGFMVTPFDYVDGRPNGVGQLLTREVWEQLASFTPEEIDNSATMADLNFWKEFAALFGWKCHGFTNRFSATINTMSQEREANVLTGVPLADAFIPLRGSERDWLHINGAQAQRIMDIVGKAHAGDTPQSLRAQIEDLEARLHKLEDDCPHELCTASNPEDIECSHPVCMQCGYRFDGWFCPDSPNGRCEYKQPDGDYDPDCCNYCGQPDERK